VILHILNIDYIPILIY